MNKDISENDISWLISSIVVILFSVFGFYGFFEIVKQSEIRKEEKMKALNNQEISDIQYKWITNWKEEAIKNNFKETLQKINESLEDNKITNQEFETIRVPYARESKELEIQVLKNK